MATIHVSDISVGLASLLALIRQGDRVVIEQNAVPVAILSAPEGIFDLTAWPYATAAQSAAVTPAHRNLSEAIRLADQRASTVTLDDEFGEDLKAIIRLRERETLRNPWE